MVVRQSTKEAVSKFIIGPWASPWASQRYLRIRVAIDVQRRTIVILQQLVDESWIPFDNQ
jgi:hypothetical protein